MIVTIQKYSDIKKIIFGCKLCLMVFTKNECPLCSELVKRLTKFPRYIWYICNIDVINDKRLDKFCRKPYPNTVLYHNKKIIMEIHGVLYDKQFDHIFKKMKNYK